MIRNAETRMGISIVVACAASVLWAYFVAREIHEPLGATVFVVAVFATPVFWVAVHRLTLKVLGG